MVVVQGKVCECVYTCTSIQVQVNRFTTQTCLRVQYGFIQSKSKLMYVEFNNLKRNVLICSSFICTQANFNVISGGLG